MLYALRRVPSAFTAPAGRKRGTVSPDSAGQSSGFFGAKITRSAALPVDFSNCIILYILSAITMA